MGLQQAHVDVDNQSGNYWRVLSVIFSGAKEKVANINAALYKDKATRDAAAPDNEPMCVKDYPVEGTDYDTHFGLAALDIVSQNPYTQVYAYLKTLDGTGVHGVNFTTATDVPVGGGAD